MIPSGCVERCRACRFREIPLSEGVFKKHQWLGRALEPWKERLEPVRAPSESRSWGYREKTCLRAGFVDSAWKFGLLDRDLELVPIPECPVHSNRVNQIFSELSQRLSSVQASSQFAIAFVAIHGPFLTLVLKAKSVHPELLLCLEDRSWNLDRLGVQGVFLNLNPSAGNRVFAPKGWSKIRGQDLVQQDGVWYGPSGFQQLIPELYQDALDEALRFLSPHSGSSVLDLCSGSGASMLRWKTAGAQTLGVELGRESVQCAERLLGPGLVLRGKSSDRIPQMRAWNAGRSFSSRLLFANPPRLGLEPEVCQWIAEEFRPERIAYLSCSAGTLNRDMSILEKAGYGVKKLIPYDFFPRTHHVEVLALASLVE